MTIRLSRRTSISDFPQAEWDSLLDDGAFYGSHSWLKSVENLSTFRASYLAARNRVRAG